MKHAALALLLLLLAPPPAAQAREHETGITINRATCCDAPTRWARRHDTGAARMAITTRGGCVTLLLTDDVVAVQLSDRSFHRVDRELRHKEREDEDAGPLGQAIRSAVLSGVRTLLDHSAECDVRDVREARYRDGRLALVTTDGERLFDDFEVDHQRVMEDFPEADARAFVREFQLRRARLR